MKSEKNIKAKLNLALAYGLVTLTGLGLFGRVVYLLEEKKEKTDHKTETNISLKENKALHNFQK